MKYSWEKVDGSRWRRKTKGGSVKMSDGGASECRGRRETTGLTRSKRRNGITDRMWEGGNVEEKHLRWKSFE